MPRAYFRNAQSMLRNWIDNDVFHLKGAGGPQSGVRNTKAALSGTGAGLCGKGSTYTDVTNGVVYINEGSRTTPYWTPLDMRGQRPLIGVYVDWRNGVGNPIADTNPSVTLVESGLRTFGSGIEQTDSGITVASAEGGPVASIIASAGAARLVALSVDGVNPTFQPDTEGPLVIDAIVAMSSALTLRNFFLGFISGLTGGAGGTIIDATIAVCTGSGTTITLVQDDLVGLFMAVGLTNADGLFFPYNKSDAAATIATTATGVDTGTDFPAAGTYVRLRVEVTRSGHATAFINKTQVSQVENALDADEEVNPIMYIESTSAATKTMLCKQFAAWGTRRAA